MTMTRHPLLVPRSRKGRAIPLLPLWAVRAVQSLSACTRVHFTLPFYTKMSPRYFKNVTMKQRKRTEPEPAALP